MLEYHVLGGVRVVSDGDELPVGGERQRRLLAALLVHADEVVSTDRLVEAVFAGDPTPAAATTLRSYVARLRKVLQDGAREPVVETRAPGYLLRVPDDAVDAARFERLVAEAQALRAKDDAVGAASAFRHALDLWDGDPYAEFAGEDWVLPEARRLGELRLVAEEQLADAELACGLAAELVPRLESLVDEEPLRESLRSGLMVALYRGGRQATALEVMADYRGLLAEERGLDPSPELVELEQRILVHDEELQRVEPRSRVVRGYRLGERLGAGRDGVVHAARLPGIERDLVIREVPAELADRADVARSFDSALRRVAALHHEAIVTIHDHWREPGAAHVVMRRMRGGTLRDRLHDGRLGTSEVADLAGRIGSALEAATDAGIVHGRVIPESVLFDEAGQAYLADFPFGDRRGEPADDVVAFAALVHESLTGRRPADGAGSGDPAAAVLASALSADPPPAIGTLVADFEQAAGMAAPTATPTVNPYKGLRAFDETDAEDFFGRRGLVEQLVHRLSGEGLAGRLVLVVGASGSGKSSVVRAGLLPKIRVNAVPGSGAWFVATMIPGATPFKELAEGLGRVAIAAEADSPEPPHMDLARELARHERALDGLLRQVIPDGGELLLVVDQFEELFTLADDDAQRAFLDTVMHALTVSDSRLRVVATLRADFYDRPLRFAGFGAAVDDATVTVPAMEAAELEAAIQGPADRVGLDVEAPLVAELVAAVVDQPAAMPSLQFTLYELARHGSGGLDLAGYRELGGVGGAIASRAESLYGSMEDHQDTVRHVFEQLLVIGAEGEPTRRPTPRSELAALTSDRPIDEVVEPWVQARLLSYDRHPETREPTVEVAHEALLREWPRLRGWIEADRTAIVAAGQLREAAASWESLDHDPGALYRGTKLETTLEQLSGRTERLPVPAREFLDASRTARDERRAREAERIAGQERTNRRLRRQLVALGLAMVIAAVGGLLALDQRGQAQDQAQRAQDEAGQARQAAQRAEEQERVAAARELAAASVTVVTEDPELSTLLALEAIERTRAVDGSVLPEAEDALHRAVTESRIVMSVPGLGGSVDWSPDGTVFVTEGPEESGLIDLRDAETGESVVSFTGHEADVNDVTFSPDGALLATTGDDGLVRVWDTATWDLEAELQGDGQVWAPSFSPDGSWVAAGWVNEGVVRVLDLATSESPVEIRAPTGNVSDSTSFSPDGERLAIATFDVLVVDTATGDEVLRFEPSDTRVAAVAWSPDGRWIASASEDGVTRVTASDTGEHHLDLVGHAGMVRRFDWGPDGRLATGGIDGTARVWEIAEGGTSELLTLAARDTLGAVGGVAFSPDGQQLLAGDVRVTAAKIWDVGIAGGAEWVNLPAPAGVSRLTAAFTPDGDTLVATGDGVPAVVWDLATGEPEVTLGVDQGHAWEIAVSPDGHLVATISFDNPPQVHVWDPRSGSEVFTVEQEAFFPEQLAWSPNGELLAVAGFNDSGPGSITIVDRTGRLVAKILEEENFEPQGVDFGPDAETLVVQRRTIDREDPTIDSVRVWDWGRGEVVTSIPVFAQAVAFDPTGPRIAVAEVGLGASIWDADTGERLATLSGHTGDVLDVTFSPDGGTVATAGGDGSVRLWPTEPDNDPLVLRGHDGPVTAVGFSPDGDRLVSVGNGMARVWALDLDDLVDIAKTRLTRSLTDDECRQYLHVETCP